MSDEIHRKLDQIINLIVAIAPSHKLPGKLLKIAADARTPENVVAERRKQILRVHKAAGVNQDIAKKITQNYPNAIRKQGMDAVPRAALLHRVAQSPIFAPLVEHGEINALENAKACLAGMDSEGDLLVVRKLNETTLGDSSVVVVFGKALWEKIKVGEEVEEFIEVAPYEAEKTLLERIREHAAKDKARVTSVVKETKPPKKILGVCEDCGERPDDCMCGIRPVDSVKPLPLCGVCGLATCVCEKRAVQL